MLKSLVAAWVFILSCSNSYCVLSQPDDDPLPVRKTVVYIETVTQETQTKKATVSSGTGFLIASENGICLITAAHIARTTNPDTNVRLLSTDKPVTVPLVKLTVDANWFYHENADVAAIKLNKPPDWSFHVFQRIQVSNILQAPPRERPVTVIGFPLRLGVDDFSPISKTFNPASDLVIAPGGNFPEPVRYYFLDSPGIGGYSGAPVFHVPGQFSRGNMLVFRKDFACVGLVHGTLSDETGGKLAAIVPAKFIAEAFDLAVTK